MSVKCLRQAFAVQIADISLVTGSSRKLGSASDMLCGCSLMGIVTIAFSASTGLRCV